MCVRKRDVCFESPRFPFRCVSRKARAKILFEGSFFLFSDIGAGNKRNWPAESKLPSSLNFDAPVGRQTDRTYMPSPFSPIGERALLQLVDFDQSVTGGALYAVHDCGVTSRLQRGDDG